LAGDPPWVPHGRQVAAGRYQTNAGPVLSFEQKDKREYFSCVTQCKAGVSAYFFKVLTGKVFLAYNPARKDEEQDLSS
jgi:hypothetical protein